MGRRQRLRSVAGLVGVAVMAALILPDVMDPLRPRSALLDPNVDGVLGWVSLGLVAWTLSSPRSASGAASGRADSLLLGALGLLLAACSVVTLGVVIHAGVPFDSGLFQLAITMELCTPALGLVNLFLSHRDEKHGLRAQAR